MRESRTFGGTRCFGIPGYCPFMSATLFRPPKPIARKRAQYDSGIVRFMFMDTIMRSNLNQPTPIILSRYLDKMHPDVVPQ